MKKLLLLPIVFGFIFLIFNLNSTSTTTPNIDSNLTSSKEKLNIEKSIEIYNTNYNEINYSNIEELVDSNESNFTVNIGSDINTTRDINVSFIADVNNADNIESCNYFWKIVDELDNKRSAFGREIRVAFPKGESSVTVDVICGEQEANATIRVTAWEYFEKKIYHYNPYYGDLEYTEREIFDYRGKHLIMDNGVFSKDNFVYNSKGLLIEHTTLYYHYPAGNVVYKFAYNDKGEKISEKSFTLDGKLLSISLFKYNEHGDMVSHLSGPDMEHLIELMYIFPNPKEESVVYESSEIYEEEEEEEQKEEPITHKEYNYGDMKIVYDYSYYDDGNIEKEKRRVVTDMRESIREVYYNKKGQIVKSKVDDTHKKYGKCSFKSEYTYNKQGYRATSEDTLLEGECPYIDEVKRKYIYDDKGAVVSVRSIINGDEKDGFITMKVVEFYTNELEEF